MLSFRLLLACILLYGVSAIPPDDPDAYETETTTAVLCGSRELEPLFENIRELRSALIFEGYHFVDVFGGSISGFSTFKIGFCDAIYMLGALNPTQYAAIAGPFGAQQTILQVPFAVGAISVVHNIPGISEGVLQLNADVLAQIYNCEITSWADSRVTSLNKGIRLPAERIIPFAPFLEPPVTLAFTQYLSLLSTAWPRDRSYNMSSPACVVAHANATQQRGYALGYGILMKSGGSWTSASLQNKAGRFTKPSRNYTYLADMHMPVSTADWSSFTLATAEHPEAYPLAFLSFAIFDANSYTRGFPAGKQIQNVAHALLSEPVQHQIQSSSYFLSRIHFNGSAIKSIEADVARMVVQQASLEGEVPKICKVCGSETYKQLLFDVTTYQNDLRYNIGTYRGDAEHSFAIGQCNMMLLDDSPPNMFRLRQGAGQQIVQVPFAWNKLLVVHTIPGVSDDSLRLDADILAAIFQCNITTWNHPKIVALNEHLTLPSAQIRPMLDQSSPAFIRVLQRYLHATSSNWSVAPDRWFPPACIIVLKNSTMLHETQFALGLRQLRQNKSSPMKAVLINNRAGAWVSGVTSNASLPEDLRLPSATEGTLWSNFTLATSGANDVYPLTSASVMVWELNSTSAGYPVGENIKKISSAFVSESIQQTLPQYSLTPLGKDATEKFLTVINATQVAKKIDFIPASDPIKANWTIQAGCSEACGWICNTLVESVAPYEVKAGRPFQVQSTFTSDQEVVDKLLGSSTNLDIVLSHAPASAEAMAASSRRIVHIPFGFYPLVVMYNISGITPGALKLDAHALARLYSCKSLKLNDYIQGLNPELRLPDVNITPVALARSHLTSQILISYLAQDAAWDGEARSMKTWPSCVKVARDGIFYTALGQWPLIFKNPNTIGYAHSDVFAIYQTMPRRAKGNVASAALTYKPGAASLRNTEGVFMSPVPTSKVPFPYNASSFPAAITSPDWAKVPQTKDIPGAYPIGSLIYLIADQNIGSTGTFHAKRLRSLMRSFLTHTYEDYTTYNMTGLHDVYVSLPPDMVHWANEQVSNLSILPLPPKFMPDSGVLIDDSRQRDKTLILALSVGLAGLLLVGIPLAGILIYMRTRSTFANMVLLADSECKSGSENSYESLELMANSHGNVVELGSGTYGKVYKGRWRGVLVAVKVLHRTNSEQQEELLKEAALLQRLRHPNIVNFLGLGTNGSDQVMMITEFMQGGDLRKALDQESLFMEMRWYKKGQHIALGLAQSLAYLHSQSVISFDVKPENVLLDHKMTDARLTDVGLAKVLEGSHTNTMCRGTFDYMAPELFGSYILDSDALMPGEYRPEVTYAVDIYSFGCVLWEIITGQRMRRSETPLRNPRVPEECPPSIAELLTKCLSRDPTQRPNAAHVVSTCMLADA